MDAHAHSGKSNDGRKHPRQCSADVVEVCKTARPRLHSHQITRKKADYADRKRKKPLVLLGSVPQQLQPFIFPRQLVEHLSSSLFADEKGHTCHKSCSSQIYAYRNRQGKQDTARRIKDAAIHNDGNSLQGEQYEHNTYCDGCVTGNKVYNALNSDAISVDPAQQDQDTPKGKHDTHLQRRKAKNIGASLFYFRRVISCFHGKFLPRGCRDSDIPVYMTNTLCVLVLDQAARLGEFHNENGY